MHARQDATQNVGPVWAMRSEINNNIIGSHKFKLCLVSEEETNNEDPKGACIGNQRYVSISLCSWIFEFPLFPHERPARVLRLLVNWGNSNTNRTASFLTYQLLVAIPSSFPKTKVLLRSALWFQWRMWLIQWAKTPKFGYPSPTATPPYCKTGNIFGNVLFVVMIYRMQFSLFIYPILK